MENVLLYHGSNKMIENRVYSARKCYNNYDEGMGADDPRIR